MSEPSIERRYTSGAWRTVEREEGGGGGAGTLAEVLAAGNDANGLPIENLDDPTDPQDAATKAYVDSGGGSSPISVVRVPIAFDTPNIAVQAFAITAVNVLTPSFTIAGDQTALFPVGFVFTVGGSTLNDGSYTVDTAVFGTETVITVEEVIADATVDGDIINTVNGVTSAGVVVYTPAVGEIVLFGNTSAMFIETAFDGNTPTGYFFFEGATDYLTDISSLSAVDMTTADSPENAGEDVFSPGGVLGGSSAEPERFATTNPLMFVIDDASNGAPGSTQGEGEIVLMVLAAP